MYPYRLYYDKFEWELRIGLLEREVNSIEMEMNRNMERMHREIELAEMEFRRENIKWQVKSIIFDEYDMNLIRRKFWTEQQVERYFNMMVEMIQNHIFQLIYDDTIPEEKESIREHVCKELKWRGVLKEQPTSESSLYERRN